MNPSVTVRAPAKINLWLGVGPVRDDGFHGLATVYQAVDVYDDVTVTAASSTTVTVVGDGVDVSDVPTDSRNLALRAATLLAGHAGLGDADAAVAMTIRKRIPVAGGMAGGSTDASAALLACDALWGLGTPRSELIGLASGLGSDVPFCLVGGTALGSGRGELVEPLEDRGSHSWVAAFPGGGLSTPAVYAELDRLSGPDATEPVVPPGVVEALVRGRAQDVARVLANDLQPAALSLRPELADVLQLGAKADALAAMLSGSGPTCLFLAADEDHASRVRSVVQAAGVRCLVARGPVPGAHLATAL